MGRAGSGLAPDGSRLEILRHALYRFNTDSSEVETLVENLREHLSFGESDVLEAMMERDSGDVPIVDPEPGHGEDESPLT